MKNFIYLTIHNLYKIINAILILIKKYNSILIKLEEKKNVSRFAFGYVYIYLYAYINVACFIFAFYA